jgi:bifunctional N-acetylglucosamine-1-phosphate-uridyltransferase/glucosamine-1-phosphate-acetyltransferase GlmU-like protein
LSGDFKITNEVAIHKTARIEENVTMKGPMIISADCFIGAHAYLRGGVYLGDKAVVGPGCEVKSSLILSGSALAHFNFVGDSLIGSYVNMEAGSIIANHYNERLDKTIYVLINKKKTSIGVTKFGALVGDHTKIGANGVLSPGTILSPQSTVKRLELIEQC